MLLDMDRLCILLNLLSLTFAHVAADALVRPRFARTPDECVRGYVIRDKLVLPACFLAFILFVQPLLQRSEVFEQRAGVGLAFAG